MLANSEGPDQTPRSEASDLGLHCLPMSQKWDARLIWVEFLPIGALRLIWVQFLPIGAWINRRTVRCLCDRAGVSWRSAFDCICLKSGKPKPKIRSISGYFSGMLKAHMTKIYISVYS